MQAHTKKPRTEDGLVTLNFMVHPANVKRITRFVKAVEPDEGEEGSITAETFFAKHFKDRSERAGTSGAPATVKI